MEVDHVIKVTLTNEILKRISEIDEKRFSLSTIEMTPVIKNRLRTVSYTHLTLPTILRV